MPRTRMHADEVFTDVGLMRQLLADQFPQWANLPVAQVDSYGTDHDIYRIGDELSARLPRIGWALDQANKERQLLPLLAPQLPLAVPVQLAIGAPARDYPYRWSVCAWLAGHDATSALDDFETAAVDLARFVRALRRVDTTGAQPRATGSRGGRLDEYDDAVRSSISELGDRIDGAAALSAWNAAIAAPRGNDPDVWLHGDLLPGNLLAVDGRLSAVIDWGGLNVGDPACDLIPAWNVFRGASRARFRAELDIDDASWLRARGWTLVQAIIALPYYWDTNAGVVGQALRALEEVLGDATQ